MSTKSRAEELADAYASASFEQGLHQRVDDPEPESARAAFVAELRRLAGVEAERDRLNRLLDEAVTRYDQMTEWFKSAQQKAASALAERDRLSAEVEALRSDVAGYVQASSEMAAEIESLKAEIERGRSYYELMAAHRLELVKENMNLQTAWKRKSEELGALKADAERYRWLRHTLHASVGGGVEVNDQRLVYEDPEPGEAVRVFWYPNTPVGFNQSKADTLDAAIDAARLQASDEGEGKL